jgi:hypothetical protein
VTNQGGGVSLRAGLSKSTHLTYKNITLKAANDVSGADTKVFFRSQVYDKADYSEKDPNGNYKLGMAPRADLKNVDVQQSQGGPQFQTYGISGARVYDFYIDTLSIDNTAANGSKSKNLLSNRSRTTNQDTLNVVRMCLFNSSFNVYGPEPTSSYARTHYYLQEPEKAMRLRDCTSPAGQESDSTGSYTSDASDEGNSYVLIPTSLMSLGQELSATVTSGNRTVQDVENADSNGNVLTFDPNNPQAFDPRDPYLKVNLDSAIQTGETITVDWTARVTPTADYQPTGIFDANRLQNKTFTSGNGPFTVDLRGAVLSQETQDPPEYSASSGNSSVVTATVNSYEDPNFNQIPWELELTEQGTGTATITVTAEIPAISDSVQTTFDVTIS